MAFQEEVRQARKDARLTMSKRYDIRRIANIKAPDGTNAVFYEVWEVFDVDHEERSHRNADLAFKTEAEAQAWIDRQSE